MEAGGLIYFGAEWYRERWQKGVACHTVFCVFKSTVSRHSSTVYSLQCNVPAAYHCHTTIIASAIHYWSHLDSSQRYSLETGGVLITKDEICYCCCVFMLPQLAR